MTGKGEGIAAPDAELALSPDLQGILADIRALKAEINSSADKLGRLEKALRMQCKDRI